MHLIYAQFLSSIAEKYLNRNKMERLSQYNSTESHNLSKEVIFFARCGAELVRRIPNAVLNERSFRAHFGALPQI